MDKKEHFRKLVSVMVEVLVFVGMFLLQFGTMGFTTAGLWASAGTFIITYVASVIIANNEYNNGIMQGKSTEKYKSALTLYSQKAGISGEKKLLLPRFCAEYTKEIKEQYQRTVLEDNCISFREFSADYKDDGGNICPALKTLTKKELISLLGKERGRIVHSVKKHKIYELKSCDILDAQRVKCETKPSESEDELKRRETISNAIAFFFFALFTSVFAIVGTHGLTLASFGMFLYQCSIIAMRGVMAHFKGYLNVTVRLVARMIRQGDYLDMFENWYEKNKNLYV